MPYYLDPEKEAKLQEAIKLGFIEKHIGQDNIVKYVLTNHGIRQWQLERFFVDSNGRD